MERKEAINWLRIMLRNENTFPSISSAKKKEALKFAINSLEVDEFYQLEYEQIYREEHS